MSTVTATVECSFHSGHPDLASQYAGRYWAWTPEATDRGELTREVGAFVRQVEVSSEGMELRLEDGSLAEPYVEVIWDGALHGMVEALWACSSEDHDDEDCACYVERTEFRTTFDGE